MKSRKIYIVILFLVMFIITGCSNGTEVENDDIFGSYAYYECIYLANWSSSTIDNQTGLHKNKYFYEITSDKLSIHDEENNLIESFENIEYISVEIDKDLDGVFSFGLEDIFDSMLKRYDIYVGDNRIGYSIFIENDKIYLADTTYTGPGRNIFAIWSLFELKIQ